MYIWVVLATFLAILASYTLAPRADYRQLAIEPLAEASIAKIVTKHTAARDYVRYHKKPYTTLPNKVEYNPGIVADADLDHYMAFGHYNDPEYVSQIFCMNEDMTAVYADRNACDVRKNKKMVVTYGPIPRRWVNMLTDLEVPTTDFMNAMRDVIDSGTTFGYTAPVEAGSSTDRNISNSDMRIIDRDFDDFYVPMAIVKDSNFKRVCDLSKGYVCLIYQSGI